MDIFCSCHTDSFPRPSPSPFRKLCWPVGETELPGPLVFLPLPHDRARSPLRPSPKICGGSAVYIKLSSSCSCCCRCMYKKNVATPSASRSLIYYNSVRSEERERERETRRGREKATSDPPSDSKSRNVRARAAFEGCAHHSCTRRLLGEHLAEQQLLSELAVVLIEV